MKTQSFVITGMTCANCVHQVNKALDASDSVLEETVNLATEKAKVVMTDDSDFNEVIQAVRHAGYGAIVDDKANRDKIRLAKLKAEKQLFWSFVFSALLSLPMLIDRKSVVFQVHALMVFHNPL